MRDNPNLSAQQPDRIRSVAQLRSVQAGEVLYETSQPDIPQLIQAGLLVLQLHLGMAQIGRQQYLKARRDCLIFLRATSSRNM